MTLPRCWQPVVDLKYVGASRYTGYVARTAKLTLKCGHELYRKASIAIPQRARCIECEHNGEIRPQPDPAVEK